ncbi:MAG: DMT family transporter [Candidatus Thorarchaeota archaeon]|nr:DMT family transporter [Candidatus Thorarchaeota archaeon]
MLVIIISLWGLNFIISRFLTGIDPVRVSGVLFALLRYSLGALTLIGVMAYQRKGPRAISEEIRPYRNLLFLSAILSAIFVIGVHTSTEFITSGTSSIIVNLSPVVVLVFGVLFLKERLSPMKSIGFLLGLLGGLIFLWTSITIVPGIELGVLLALVGTFAWGAYTITLHYLEGADRYVVMTVTLVTSSLLLLAFIVAMIVQGFELILIVDVFSVTGFLISGVLGSGVAYVLYFTVVEILGATRASSFLFLMPFVSVVGDFALGEPPEFVILLAGLIAIIGVGFIRLSGLKENAKE